MKSSVMFIANITKDLLWKNLDGNARYVIHEMKCFKYLLSQLNVIWWYVISQEVAYNNFKDGHTVNLSLLRSFWSFLAYLLMNVGDLDMTQNVQSLLKEALL